MFPVEPPPILPPTRPCLLAGDTIRMALQVSVLNIPSGAGETVTISVNAPSSADAFLVPVPGIVDCGGAANVGHGDACTLVVSTDGDYVVPFSLGPARPPGFTLVASPGGKSVQVGRDASVANPTGVVGAQCLPSAA